MYNAIGGDKESSIHMDGGRNELEAFEMSESSAALMHAIPNIPRTSKGPKSKLSQSQSSAKTKNGTVKAKKSSVPANSETMSIKSGTTSKGGTKKKKKTAHKGVDDKSSAGSDTARTQIVAPPVIEEVKIEEPVIPERPKKTFI